MFADLKRSVVVQVSADTGDTDETTEQLTCFQILFVTPEIHFAAVTPSSIFPVVAVRACKRACACIRALPPSALYTATIISYISYRTKEGRSVADY